MTDTSFGIDLMVVFLSAIGGGLLAHRLRLPTVIGYLLAGILVSPQGLGLVQSTEVIRSLAEIGVVLLLFTLGLQFSFKELKSIGRVATLGGTAQIALTAAAGFALGKLFGWANTEAVFFGFLIALSSTLIVIKTLMDRGEMNTTQGRVMLGILIVQDLSLVPLMIILPAMGQSATEIVPSLVAAIAKTLGFIALMLTMGLWVLPRLVERIARVKSRELFLLTAVSLSLAAAIGAIYFGLSAAVGAFIAGLFIGQSVFSRQMFADIVPFRDIFGALFFVSLGTLADLSYVWSHPLIIVTAVLLIVMIKFIIAAMIPWVFGYNARVALFTGMGLIQIGEFSFVLAGVGISAGILSGAAYSITLSAAIITMVLTPFALMLADIIYRRLEKTRLMTRLLEARPGSSREMELKLSGHTVICGHGQVGSTLARVLKRRNLSYLVIDLDPQVIARLRAEGVPCIYGDTSNPDILAYAQLEKAKLLVCTIPGFIDIELTAKYARAINPKLDVVARVQRDQDIAGLKTAGVSELVQPEFEASLEITRHALHRYGLSGNEIQIILNNLRQQGGAA